eukprot:1158580-Pelagomonas_calceolata.AAC.17
MHLMLCQGSALLSACTHTRACQTTCLSAINESKVPTLSSGTSSLLFWLSPAEVVHSCSTSHTASLRRALARGSETNQYACGILDDERYLIPSFKDALPVRTRSKQVSATLWPMAHACFARGSKSCLLVELWTRSSNRYPVL